jgi:hypothetical protein
MRALSVFLPLLLTACAASNNSLTIPDTPAGLAACTAAPIPAIPGDVGTPLTKAQAAEALADQRAAALAKDRCAGSWASFYDNLKTLLESSK